jgi:hypothetical protein
MLKKFLYFIVLICFAPLIMWLLWLFTPKTKLVAAIIDKTVLTKEGQEHSSLVLGSKSGEIFKDQ